MKKKCMCNTKIVYFIVLMIIAGIASCQKQLPDNFDGYVINGGSQSQTIVDPQLTLDASRLEFSSESGSKTFFVTSNTSWTVSSNEEWCSVNLTSGKNNSSVTVNVTENKSTSSRFAAITVETSSITKTLEVTQEGATSSSSQARTFTVGGVEFKMIAVEGGTFTMGATPEQGDDVVRSDKPTHTVTLSSYSIGETEVTQALWETVMGSNPSVYNGNNRPVECVSWEDCQEFLTKLNAKTSERFRLPTEAEWEFAARGGIKSQGYKYSGSNKVGDVAWYSDNSSTMTHDVATKQSNELGLYDMSGNVYEWCNDWYGDYSSSAQTNPTGPVSGKDRILRGGCWNSEGGFYSYGSCRISSRSLGLPSKRTIYFGFRLAL